MSELGGGQAGGFNSPYNPNLRANNSNGQSIRKTAPQTPVETAPTTEAATPTIDKQSIANEVVQRRLDSQRIHKQVEQNRSAEVDSYSSRTETGNTRTELVSRFTSHPYNVRAQEQRQHRERLARNLNNASLGLEDALAEEGKAAEDQSLVSHLAQSAEDIDPDAKARKDLKKKRNDILRLGGPEAKPFIRFVDSQTIDGLVNEEVQGLINGFHENVLKETTRMTPAEMVDGDHAMRFFADKIDPNNKEDMQALNTSLATAHGSSTALKQELYISRQMADRNRVRLKPKEFIQTEVKVSKQERVIMMAASLPSPKWPEGSLQAA
ncbi:MAG: hypothetical protein O2962_00700 [Cyanobacteria bacterium]|nr:hypothetical protein [Cyanobacteriota bacterium]